MGLICDKQQDSPVKHVLSSVQIFLGKETTDVRTWERIF